MSSSSSALPPLSIIIPTLRGWPAIEPCLDALLAQADALNAEIVVADGSDGAGPPAAIAADVRWHAWPGLGIFDLRLRALRQARGPILALTEDHCLAAPDWCRAVIEAHRDRPHLQAIKGVVTNGSPARALDRAAFLMNQLPHLPPVDGGPFAGVFSISCTSLRREAVDALHARVGPMPPELAGAWLPADAIGADERVRVAHVQAESTWETLALQFHNARAIAGHRQRARQSRDWLRLVAAPALPWVRAVRLTVACHAKHVPARRLLESAPLFVVLLHAKGLGEVAGYLAGPGDSARLLQ